MKAITNYIKEFGVIVSYSLIFVMSYFFEWKPITFYITCLIEIFIIYLIFVILHFYDERKKPKKSKKTKPIKYLDNYVVAVIIFLAFFIYNKTNTRKRYEIPEEIDINELFYISLILLFFYVFDTLNIHENKKRLKTLQKSVFSKILVLFLINMIGFTLYSTLMINSGMLLLFIMTLCRIALEIYFFKDENHEDLLK